MHVPFAGGWRIHLQLFEEDDKEYYGSEEGVREWLPKVMDPNMQIVLHGFQLIHSTKW